MAKRIQLTAYALSGGCSAKVGPSDLQQMLAGLEPSNNADVLVDMSNADDAGVLRIDRNVALVHTIDVITPNVDDPKTFGRVAATNAISDIYAMGGQPTSAVSLLSVPKALPVRAVAPILAGASEVLDKAGAPLIGGHTLKDSELKLGFAVTGTVEPRRVVTNGGARPKETLVLTKALGTGILYQAMKKGIRTAKQTKAMVASMLTSNRVARDIMVDEGVRCATDVTGFGLAGHALNIALGSDVDVILFGDALPSLPGVQDLLDDDVFPGTVETNLAGFGRAFIPAKGVRTQVIRLVADPQTSGGLLISTPSQSLKRVLSATGGWVVGEIRKKRGPKPAVRMVSGPELEIAWADPLE